MRYLDLSTLVFGLALAVPALGAVEPNLARLVPADAALVVALHDVPDLRRSWPESAAGRAWADPGLARFIAPLLNREELSALVTR